MINNSKPVIITGGAGFIGTNLAHRLLEQGQKVIVVDNLSRNGSRRNLQWLFDNHNSDLRIRICDVRDRVMMAELLNDASAVFHFAAQVAVTKSIENPIDDFKTNVEGTLNILELLRIMDDPPFLLFTSTNKVYGKLSNIELVEKEYRYHPVNEKYSVGIDENTMLDFQSPYGCSKGCADQYILDYCRTYSVPASVFRMSCIYGPHQYGNEDQGWVAHFLFRIMQNQPVTVYGDGKQVRDILYIDDLLNAFELIVKNRQKCCGQAFTIGGGPANSISVLECIDLLQKQSGKYPPVSFAPWRNGDQCYYVSNVSKFHNLTGWKPSVDITQGINGLSRWVSRNISSDVSKIVKEKTV
ncbi:MAG TPA: SDR family NAD(P)-dependent oxidoreductase [Chitinispirillaceae bacterium]|nr:SDR family NAD(P)-dependent oxidoreductase [Chitinispirillaceae bacterium]